MKLHSAERTLRFGTPLEKATGALILIHGRGGSPDDIAGIAEHLPSRGLAFLAPAAEGGTWYPQRFMMPLASNEPWLSSALGVLATLAGVARSAGIGPECLGFIGFSQGACLALEFVARSPRRYRFVAGLSGALIGPAETPRLTGDLGGTPILLGCAERDPHIPIDFVERSATALAGMNADLTKQVFPGAAHTLFPEEIAWIRLELAKGGEAPPKAA
jgi:phospholipase/carboxylesterase